MFKLKSIRVPKYAKSGFTEWQVVNRDNHQLVGFIRFTSSGNDYRYTAYVKDDNNPSSHLLGSSLSQAGAMTLVRNYYKAQEQTDAEIEQLNLLNELEHNQ